MMMFGVPEDAAGNERCSQLMKILLPNCKQILDSERIGENSSNKHPRRLRVFLPNPVTKRTAFLNHKNLKDLEQFKRVSV